MSAYILGCLPPGIAAVICVTNKDYIMRLTQDGIGITLIIVAVVSMLIGFLWMNKIIKIEI
jgi:tight adherence protein B